MLNPDPMETSIHVACWLPLSVPRLAMASNVCVRLCLSDAIAFLNRAFNAPRFSLPSLRPITGLVLGLTFPGGVNIKVRFDYDACTRFVSLFLLNLCV